MLKQRDAIVRLLGDDDPRTVELVKHQLVNRGAEIVPGLRELLRIDNAAVARNVREILGEIDAAEARTELTALCQSFPDGELEEGCLYELLEDACLLLARALAPGCDVNTVRNHFDLWGVELGRRYAGTRSKAEQVLLLGEFFGQELGFHGNVENYYTVANSLLPEVTKRRTGIPISLSIVYMLTGWRAGMKIEGISFPGHFLVRFEDVLIDPFERGKILTLSDCATLLIRQNLRSDPSYFEAASPKTIFHRVLSNLLYLYRTGDKKKALWVADWMSDLEESPEEF